MNKKSFYVFSYWLFIWFILFYFNIISFNPLPFLIIAYIFTIIVGTKYLLNHNANKYNLTKFIILNIIIKFIPICLIILNSTDFNIYDIYFGISLTLFYIIFMKIQNVSIYNFYKNLFNSFITNKNKSDFNKLYDYIYTSINKLKNHK
jgi:hypothetical protein